MSLKLTILWAGLASYSVAFFRELARSESFRIQLIYKPQSPDAPYSSFDLTFCESVLESPENTDLESSVSNFAPHCVLMTSWGFSEYMRITRLLRRRGAYVVSAMDNQWRASVKQYLGILSSRLYLRPSIDTFLVSGDRQAVFTRKLGYKDVLYGCYAAEADRFLSEVPITRRAPAFLFVGRLVPEKNIPGLASAYVRYREQVEEPWALRVAGVGPLTNALKNIPGVELLRFVQPSELPSLMNATRCLVLPSVLEPWGVIIQEAAAAGLPVIASYKCGAVTAYVRDGINGYIVSPTPEDITAALIRVSQASEELLTAMSEASVQLANLWTPKKLAAYFHKMVVERINLKRPQSEDVGTALRNTKELS